MKIRVSLIFLVLLSACGKGPYDDFASNGFSREQIQRQLVSDADVHCKDAAHCPPQVGQITSYEDESYHIDQCTGWLFSTDIVVTNSHCIPIQFKNNARSCAGNIFIKFPEAEGVAAEVAECAQIMSSSKVSDSDKEADRQTDTNIDYAFIKLKNPIKNRGSLKVDTSGVPDALDVSVYKMNPSDVSNSLDGVLEVKHCVSDAGSMLLPQYNDSHSPIVALSGCDDLQGNSGSPVVDASGKVRALIHGGRDMKKDAQSFYVKSVEKLISFAFASNTACIPFPNDAPGRVLDPRCSLEVDVQDASPLIKWIHGFDKDNNELKLATAILDFNHNHSVYMEWQPTKRFLSVDKWERGVYLDPKCFKEPSTWIDSIPKEITTDDDSFEAKQSLSTWLESAAVDKKYQLLSEFREGPVENSTLQFYPFRVNDVRKSTLKVKSSESHQRSERVLEVCPPTTLQ